MGGSKGPFIHWRSNVGVALCGLPAKQSQLAEGWEKVDCPHCVKRSMAAVGQMLGAA